MSLLKIKSNYKPFDEIYTVPEAVYPIVKYLKNKVTTIWECTDFGASEITKVLSKKGFTVYGTKFNFFEKKLDKDYDIIITNPPFSKKDNFLKRAYELNKPFMFLLPITAFEGIYRGELYRKYGIDVIVFDRRINFQKSSKSGCWFNTSWFTWKILEKQLIFEKLEKIKYPPITNSETVILKQQQELF